MAEADNTSPENLIPKAKKGSELWKWLKELLQKAAEKLKDRSSPDDDPDKKQAKEVLKNIKKLSSRIEQEKQEAVAAGTSVDHDELDKYFPPNLRELIDKMHVEDFIDKYAHKIIPKLADVSKDYITVDAGILDIGYIVSHEMGLDKALAHKVAPAIREEIEKALNRMKMAAKRDEPRITKGESTLEELNRLTKEEAPQEGPQKERRDRDTGDEVYSAYSDEGRLAARLQGRMKSEDLAWFEAMVSPEKFSSLFDERVKALTDSGIEAGAAQVAISDKVTEFVMNSLMTIYNPILDEEPKEFFEKQAQNSGSYNDNPYSAARTFSKMLNALREKSEIDTLKTGGEASPLSQKKFRRLDREVIVVQDDSAGQLVERTMPSTKKSEAKIGEFVEYLREVFETGEDTIDYGHNFKLLTTLGPREGPRGTDPFFSQIKGLAKRFTADKIDTAFRLPYNDVVQASKQKFQSSYARMFADYQWQKDPALLGRFLQSMPAAERRVKDELREQFKGEDVPDWALEWAFQTGRTMYFGLDFGFHEMVSYADPNLQYNGSTSFTGLGGMRGYFDMFEGAKMLNFKKDLILAKAVWTPYTLNMSDVPYDHAEWTRIGESRWKESFVMGQASYAGSFLDGQKLFIDMGNYLGVGGWGTNQGWRVREGYNSWLLPEFKGSTLNRLETPSGDSQILVRGWKRVENIGIPIAENFWQQQVRNKASDENKKLGKDQKPEFITAVVELGNHFYDRYFSDGKGKTSSVGIELLREYIEEYNHEHPGHGETDKQIFEHHIRHVLTDSHYDGARDEAMNKIMNKVATVLTLEQMPAHFVTMEKQRMTEYGVTLLSEVQSQFLPGASSASPEARKEAKKRVDDALANMVYSQEQLRRDASIEMDKSLEANKNLYGDLSQIRSTILNGQGNVLTENYIVGVLEKRFDIPTGNGLTDSRVQDVIRLYRTIHSRITSTPTLSEIRGNSSIDKLFSDAVGARAKSKKSRDSKEQELVDRVEAIEKKVQGGKFRSRVAWWSHALDSNYFGHSVTQPTVAMKFINVSAGGPDVVERDAGQAADTAELMHTQAAVAYGAFKDGAKAGHEKGIHAGYEALEDWIGSFKGKVQGELGSGPAYEMSFRMAQLVDIFFRKDDKAKRLMGEQSYWANHKKRSISDSLIDEGALLMAWDADAEYGWAHYLHHHGKLKKKPSKGVKHREIMQNSKVRKVLGRLPFIGDRLKNKRMSIHDDANTFSEHGLIGWADASYTKLFKQKWLPAIILMLIGLGVLTAKQGSKDIEIT